MNTPAKSPKNVAIDVYLSEALVARITELAVKHGRSNSAVCRDLIAAALDGDAAADQQASLIRVESAIRQQSAVLARIEVLAAAGVISPAIATAPASATSQENLTRARDITRSAATAVPGVLKHVFTQEAELSHLASLHPSLPEQSSV